MYCTYDATKLVRRDPGLWSDNVPPTICLTWPLCRSMQGRNKERLRVDDMYFSRCNKPQLFMRERLKLCSRIRDGLNARERVPRDFPRHAKLPNDSVTTQLTPISHLSYFHTYRGRALHKSCRRCSVIFGPSEGLG